MSRSSTRHDREVQGKDSAGETAPEHGEIPNDGGNIPGGGGDPNNPATGHPAIFGSPVVGVTLTATEGDVDDPDGKPPVSSWTWRWYSGATYIPNISLNQYTVQSSDIGNTITAQCAFIDGRGFAETRFSAPTAVVTQDAQPGAFFYHAFMLANIGPFQLARSTVETTNDYLGVPANAPSGIPAFTGGEFDGTDTWTDHSVGYGIRVTDSNSVLLSDFVDMSPLPAAGDTNNFCGQVAYRTKVGSASYVNGIHRVFALYDPADVAGTFFSAYHTKADSTWRFELNLGAGKVVVDGPVAALSDGDIVDVRYSKSSVTGLTFWIDSVVTNAPTHTGAFSSALTRLELNGHVGADVEDSEYQFIRLSNEDLDTDTILGWESWTQPLPIITQQPQSIQFDVDQPPTTSGEVILQGTQAIGSTLTCDHSGYTDTAGKEEPYTFRWWQIKGAVKIYVQATSSPTYLLTDRDGSAFTDAGCLFYCDFEYRNTSPAYPKTVASNTVGPIAEEGTTPPPGTTDPIVELNKTSLYDQHNYMFVDEGGTAQLWADVRNMDTFEIVYKSDNQPGVPPVTEEDRDTVFPWIPWNNQFPGLSVATGPIPERDPYDRNSLNDQDGVRITLTITNARVGDGGWFQIISKNAAGETSANNNRGYRYQIRTRPAWKYWTDVPNVYAFWSMEEYFPNWQRDVYTDKTYEYNAREGAYRERGFKWNASRMYNVTYENDYNDPAPFHLIEVNPLEGSGALIPHGPDPFNTQAWRFYNTFSVGFRKAASTQGNQVGLRHAYTTPYDTAGGMTVCLVDYRWYDTAGCSFELMAGGSSFLKVFTDGTSPNYRMSFKGGVSQDTGLPIDICDPVTMIATITPTTIKLWAKASLNKTTQDEVPGAPYVMDSGVSTGVIDTLSFYAEADDNATNAANGLFSIGAVLETALPDADIGKMAGCMYETIIFQGSRYGTHSESY